jgi:dihydrodipicolinate synthase/N-acetylneuraminate lyase
MREGMDRRRLLLGAAGLALAASAPAALAQPATKKPLMGLYPIGLTPVTPADKTDFDGLAAQYRFLQKGRVHGIAWPQIASGWAVLSEADRIQGADVMGQLRKSGDTALVIGVQSKTGDFAEVERYAKHAEKVGADGIICIPPTNLTPDQMFAFYQRVGGMTGLPVFVQAVGEFSVDLLVKLYEQVPTIRYVKDEAGIPLQRVGEIVRRTNGNMKVFSGNGVRTLITEMELGFSGHCPHTSLSDIYAAAFDFYHAGKKREAYDQFGLISAANVMFSQANPNVLIARGVFKPGTTTRSNNAGGGGGGGGNNAPLPATSVDDIRRVLDTYLKPYLRA